ncbi:pyridoxal kinase PdxY [Neorhizobium sp. NCHU2750]|uniref:pyridoxal kinase PdxY n=1 Tax=Neorhizobium sp. NCHU2750 TaxID=1825976 RepID=UPI000E7152A1|nr:pyridoxamine kinase [Neorhizobium sp. NCHU2750]
MQAQNGAVIVISSHVIRGAVGNRAAVFALESMGHPVWAFPTIVLPWHPGHGPSTRLHHPVADFEMAIDDLIRAPWLGEVKAVLSGYFGHAGQPAAVAKLIKALKQRNPEMLYVCDPVIGDTGGLYVPQAIAEAIRTDLMPLADLITPNRHELAWLSGESVDSNAQIVQAVRKLGTSRALVTSAIPMMNAAIGNLFVTEKRVFLCEHRLVDNPPNGLGDLLSAVFLSRLMSGMDEEEALRLATASIFEILARTSAEGSDELILPAHALSLQSPMAGVQMRQIVHSAKRSA